MITNFPRTCGAGSATRPKKLDPKQIQKGKSGFFHTAATTMHPFRSELWELNRLSRRVTDPAAQAHGLGCGVNFEKVSVAATQFSVRAEGRTHTARRVSIFDAHERQCMSRTPPVSLQERFRTLLKPQLRLRPCGTKAYTEERWAMSRS